MYVKGENGATAPLPGTYCVSPFQSRNGEPTSTNSEGKWGLSRQKHQTAMMTLVLQSQDCPLADILESIHHRDTESTEKNLFMSDLCNESI
jgi:hypothetical protein